MTKLRNGKLIFGLLNVVISGHISTVFNSMGNVQVGGKVPKGSSRSRIERPFTGVIAGLSINRLRVLDVAAERDTQTTIRGDVQLVTGVLDRSNDLQRMQQVRILNERQFINYYDFIREHATATTFNACR